MKITMRQLRRIIREEIGRNYHTLDTDPYTWKDYDDVHYEVHPNIGEDGWYARVDCKSNPSLSTDEHKFADEQSAEHWARMKSEEIMRATINDEHDDDNL
jgi:hypothetical protein